MRCGGHRSAAVCVTVALIACAIACARAGPAPSAVTYDVRRASVGTVALQHTLEWWEYEFAVINVVFDQPLYLSFPNANVKANANANDRGSGGGGGVFNASFHPYRHHPSSPTLNALHETISLSCASAGEEGGEYTFTLGTDWAADYYTNPQTLLPRLLPYRSAANPYRSLFRIFDVFDGASDGAAAGESGGGGDGGDGGASARSNTLSVMLMLAYASPTTTKRFVQQTELNACKLQYIPLAVRQQRAQQTAEQHTAEPAFSASLGAVTNFRGSEVRMNHALERSAVPCRHRTVLRLQQYDESSSLASWHAYYATHAPPSLLAAEDNPNPNPHHSVLNATHGARLANATSSPSSSPVALLQTRTEAQLPGIMMVFKPIFSGVLKPVVKSTTIYMCDFWIMTFTDKLFHDLIDEVVPDLTIMLGTVLDANLTNILSDSITYSVTKSISLGLARTLAPYLSTRVATAITPRLHSAINRVLIDKIPLRLRTHVPTIVNRVVQLTLTHALTRSVTHAVVPALTHALPHTKQMDVYCHSCYYHKVDRHCALCHFSPQSVYYQLYHATFFSDYYSDYYADYYAHSLQEMQTKLWPDVNGEEP